MTTAACNCPDCHMNYVGQTDRSFRLRYNEHLRDYRYNTDKSKFAQHLTERKHSFVPIDDIMSVLHKTQKGRMMDVIERYHIFKETKNKNQINDKNTVKPNIFFETIVQEHSNRWQTQYENKQPDTPPFLARQGTRIHAWNHATDHTHID
jgi:hypothetical protein